MDLKFKSVNQIMADVNDSENMFLNQRIDNQWAKRE